MSTSAALQELARQVRTSTVQLLESADPSMLTWAPPGTSNHLMWHAGHSLWLQGVLGLETLTGKDELPRGWADTFGMNCRPVASTKDWPTRDEMLRLLTEQLGQLRAALIETSEARLAETINVRGDSMASRIIHGLHDEARHQGEMLLLIKLYRVAR